MGNILSFNKRAGGGERVASATKAAIPPMKPEIVYGVMWVALDGIGSIKEQAEQACRKARTKQYSLFTGSFQGREESLAGLYPGKPTKQVKLPAAALMAAQVKTANALYIGPDGQGQLALIGLLKGMPSPSYDKAGTPAELLPVAEEYSQFLASGCAFYVHESVGAVPEMEKFCARYQAQIEVVNELPGAQLANSLSEYAFKPMGSKVVVTAIATLVLLGIVAAAGVYGWDYYTQQLEEQARKADERRKARAAYVESRDQAFAAEPAWAPLPAGTILWQSVRHLSTERAHWKLNKVTCEASGCRQSLSRNKLGTFDSLRLSLLAGESVEFQAVRLDEAFIQYAPNLEQVTKLDLGSVTAAPENFDALIGTMAQTMALADVSLSFTPAVVLGNQDLMRKSGDPSLSRKVGAWSLSGPVDSLLDSLRRLPQNSTLSRIEIQIQGDQDKFLASGRYFLP
jgi:hypothetical protein